MVHRFALCINLLLCKLARSKNKTRDSIIALITLWTISSLWHFQIPLQLKAKVAHRNFLCNQGNDAKCAFLTSFSNLLRLFLPYLNEWISHEWMSYIDLNNRKSIFSPVFSCYFHWNSIFFVFPFFFHFFYVENIFVPQHFRGKNTLHTSIYVTGMIHTFIYISMFCVPLQVSSTAFRKFKETDFWNEKFETLFPN